MSMHWLIVGPGALGQLYAGKLAQLGHGISFWGRQGLAPNLPYQWQDLAGLKHHWQSQAGEPPIDVVLVVTKVFQSDEATQAVLNSGLISATCPLILMHNGLGAGEQLARLHPEQALLLASSRHGALKLSDREVFHTGQGSTQLGLVKGVLPSESQLNITEALQAATGETSWHDRILEPLWHKLVINSVINPLTARDQIRNGALLQQSYQGEMTRLCQQACQVAEAEGVPLKSEALLAQILQVAEATAQNQSSMLQDLLLHRPTEIDYINGYLVRCAQRHGIEVPDHEQVLEQIHQLEKD